MMDRFEPIINFPEKLLAAIPNPIDLNFKRDFAPRSDSLKAQVILVKLCPRCSETLFLSQIICKSCGAYVSTRERQNWYKYKLEKREEEIDWADLGDPVEFDRPAITIRDLLPLPGVIQLIPPIEAIKIILWMILVLINLLAFTQFLDLIF